MPCNAKVLVTYQNKEVFNNFLAKHEYMHEIKVVIRGLKTGKYGDILWTLENTGGYRYTFCVIMNKILNTYSFNTSEKILCCIWNTWFQIFYMIYWIHEYIDECTIIVATGKLD